jgi:hypothetical protein
LNVLYYALIAVLIVACGCYCRIEIQNNRLLKTVTSRTEGTGTERDLVLTLLKSGIPKETIFHDLYLKRAMVSIARLMQWLQQVWV